MIRASKVHGPDIYIQRGSAIPRRISFVAYQDSHVYRGIVVTMASVNDTLDELCKDYDVVLIHGLRIANEQKESVTIYDRNTNEKIF